MIDAKRRRQTTLALLWKFVVNWDDVEREEEKSVEYFSRTFRSTLLIIGNQFLFSETNIGMPNMIVNSKNSWLTSWSNLRRREVLHYYENLILFFDSSSFKRPPANLSCWSQCCHYSRHSKVCSLYDKPFDALWWCWCCCWLRSTYAVRVQCAFKRSSEETVCYMPNCHTVLLNLKSSQESSFSKKPKV